MLRVDIETAEYLDERDQRIVPVRGVSLSLEHSLISVSKWESKWCVPFLSNREKSAQEVLDYVKCMTLTQNVDDMAYQFLSEANALAIKEYIDAPMTATTINNLEKRYSREVITAEIIYYWMIELGIPFECQKWHLNRLLTLINVCSIKRDTKPKKMSGKKLASHNSALNAARRKQLGSNG